MEQVELRRSLAAKWNPQDKPAHIFESYLVYKTEAGGPFLVGLNVPEADALESTFKAKGIEHYRVDGEYPYEVFQAWKDKDMKNKKTKQGHS